MTSIALPMLCKVIAITSNAIQTLFTWIWIMSTFWFPTFWKHRWFKRLTSPIMTRRTRAYCKKNELKLDVWTELDKKSTKRGNSGQPSHYSKSNTPNEIKRDADGGHRESDSTAKTDAEENSEELMALDDSIVSYSVSAKDRTFRRFGRNRNELDSAMQPNNDSNYSKLIDDGQQIDNEDRIANTIDNDVTTLVKNCLSIGQSSDRLETTEECEHKSTDINLNRMETDSEWETKSNRTKKGRKMMRFVLNIAPGNNKNQSTHQQPVVVKYVGPKCPPGVCGLNNLGNTCYMNSALQCLSNIEILHNFIVCYDKQESGNTLIEIYRNLTEKMWSGDNCSVAPHMLKNKVGQLFPQFDGFGQKDCSELLNCLLYRFHEELMFEKFGHLPQLLEYNTFEEHLNNNDTLIGHNFQLYQSTKVFCQCGHIWAQSYDPLFVLDLPQIEDKRSHELVVFLRISNQTLFIFELHLSNKIVFISEVIARIKELARIHEVFDQDVNGNQLIVIECVNHTIHKIYANEEILDIEEVKGKILIYFNGSDLSEGFHFLVTLMNEQNNSFGIPLLVSTKVDDNEDIVKEVYQQFIKNIEHFNSNDFETMENLVIQPIDTIKQKDLKIATLILDPIPKKLIERYRCPKQKKICDKSDANNCEIEVVDRLRRYLSIVKLEDTRRCQSCKSETTHYQRHDVMHAPNVLMMKLKTGPAKHHYRYKSRFVPQLNFDSFVSEPQSTKLVYDLNAISNHSGTTYSGHYTAFAQNFSNNKWYRFNDNYVEEVKSFDKMVSNDAYLLIYCKSNN